MEKNKVGTSKTPCICTEESVESLNDDSATASIPTFEEASEFLRKHLEKNKKCICTYDGRVKNPNRVSFVDAEDKPPECICEDVNTSAPVFDDTSSTTIIPQEEPKKKKKSFVEALKYLVTCACYKKSEDAKPEPEPEPEFEEVDTKDSGIISLLGRTYSEVSYDKDKWKKKPIVLVYDVEEDIPVKEKVKDVSQVALVQAKIKDIPKVTPEKPKTKDLPQAAPAKPKIKEVPQPAPEKVKTKDLPKVTPEKPKIKEMPQAAPAKPKTKDVPKVTPLKEKTKDLPQVKPVKPKTKDVTPKVSFGKPLPKKKESAACICTGDTASKYDSKSSSRVSTKVSQVKCKCTDPEVTPSGHLIATKCVCGQPTPSESSLASGYTIGSRGSKPDCCYPEKSEQLIRKIDYQPSSQYSYRRYDQPLQTYGREAPNIRSSYTPSATSSYADSDQYISEEDDVSQNSRLNDTESSYSYRKSTSVIPSCCVSETAAGPSEPPTLYQRLVKRFWLESIVYKEPYQPPSRVQSAPSYLSDTSLRRPASKHKPESKVQKPMTKSKEKVCRCSKTQLVAVPPKESKQKAKVEKPKTETTKAEKPKADPTNLCECLKKSVSKKSKEELIKRNVEKCHCLEVLYMSKSPSKIDEKELSKTPSKTDEKVLSKSPSDVSAGTSKDQAKTQNVPTVIVTPAEETEAKLEEKNGSKSSSNSSVVTVIDTHALQVPSVFDTRPVDVKKSAEIQEQAAGGSSAENPQEAAPAPLGNETSGWWDKSKHLIIGSTVVGATAIGAYQYFKE